MMQTPHRWYGQRLGLVGLCLLLLGAVACTTQPVSAPGTGTSPSPSPGPSPGPSPSPSTGPVPKQQLLIGTTPAASSNYAYGVAAGNVINEGVPSLNVTVMSTQGGVDSFLRLRRGETQIGVGALDVGYMVQNGIGDFKENKFEDMRFLWAHSVQAVAFVVREDSGVKTLADLEGKAYYPAARGTTTEKLIQDVLGAAGIKPNYQQGSFDDAVGATKNNRAIGFGKGTGLKSADATIVDTMTSHPIRILAWDPAQLASIQKQFPYYGTTEIPSGVYKGDWNANPIPTWSQTIGYWANKSLSADAVYAIFKALDADWHSGRSKQIAAHPPSGETPLAELTVQQATTPLHAGTIRFLKEKGIAVPDRLIPPEVK